MSDDSLADYRWDDRDEVQFVGGPLDGTAYVIDFHTPLWSYLHDDGTKAERGDFCRTDGDPRGYAHWASRDADLELVHAYVHATALADWRERMAGLTGYLLPEAAS